MNKKIVKILVAVMMVVMLCTNGSVVAMAENNSAIVDTVAPCYEIANRATSELTISGTKATCTSNTIGNGAVKITAEQTLQKQGLLWIWGDVDGASWTKTVNASSIYMSNNKTGLASGTYRLKTVFTLTASDGNTETFTVYSAEKTI